LGHHPDSHIYSSAEGFVRPQSVAVAYRRTVFGAVGMFDESFDACEDVEFNHRLDKAGFRCFFTPRVAVRYFPRGSLGGLFQQMVRYGRGRVRLLRKHPDTFTLPGFVPALFLLGLLSGPLLALFSKWLAIAYLAGVAIYVTTVLLASLAIVLRARSPRLLPWLPPVFGAIHCGAGAGILLEFLALIRIRIPLAISRWLHRPRHLTRSVQPSR
jgi:succinoglycan biosynthesis protein ExoA